MPVDTIVPSPERNKFYGIGIHEFLQYETLCQKLIHPGRSVRFTPALPFHLRSLRKIHKRHQQIPDGKKTKTLRSGPDIAREALVKLGPTYVKLGQFLSLRPDLIPVDWCAEFKKLQDQIPSFSFAQVKQVLENELGKDYAEIFSEFDETPVAAASISQVHRARLRTGER